MLIKERIRLFQSGDENQKDLIIEHYSKHAISMALRLSKSFPRKREDLISSAFMGLITGVESIRNLDSEHDGFGQIISIHVKRHMLNFVTSDYLIRVPASSIRKNGYTFSISSIQSEREYIKNLTAVDNDLTAYYELIEFLGLSTREVMILNMKSNGATVREIGSEFGMSKSNVSRIISDVRTRYETKTNKLG